LDSGGNKDPTVFIRGPDRGWHFVAAIAAGRNSRPMPVIGPRCHELRIRDEGHNWRIFYHLAPDAVVILEVHRKTTQKPPQKVLETCQRRLKLYQSVQ
jgi:phage-related protein